MSDRDTFDDLNYSRRRGLAPSRVEVEVLRGGGAPGRGALFADPGPENLGAPVPHGEPQMEHQVRVVDLAAGPCRRPVAAGDLIGTPCPDCGHTNLIHPGTHNPALECCVICELVAIA